MPQVGDELHVRAHVNLAGLTPADVSVEVVYGRARENDRLENPQSVELLPSPTGGDPAQFTGAVTLSRAGSFGYNVRVVPRHALLASPAELGLIAVAS